MQTQLWGVDLNHEFSTFSDIRAELGCSPLFAQILYNRGIRSKRALEYLFRMDLSHLPDPFCLFEMEKAAKRVVKACISQEKIAVYGDYDVDGTCGTSILVQFFSEIGTSVEAYQPNRFTEGYGVHSGAVQRLFEKGTQVLITVDCGITAVEPAKICQEKGVDLIVLDHHKLGTKLPQAFAIVNPQRSEDSSGLRNLCGAGLSFFFIMALRRELRNQGFFETRSEPNLLGYLDLVAVATVADMVDVRGVNRILVAHGINVLQTNPRPGLKAILKSAQVEKPTTMHCGFVLGPRINAAGRLKSAKEALDLLLTQDFDAAKSLAESLDAINTSRRATQDQVFESARLQALNQVSPGGGEYQKWQDLVSSIPVAALGPWPRALVLVPPEGTNWHEGVVGIVASKIVEEFKVPAFVLTDKDGSHWKGSVRSFGKIDILSAISAQSVSQHLSNFGGHAHAGGVSLEKHALAEFKRALNLHLAMTTTQVDYVQERRFDLEFTETEFSQFLHQSETLMQECDYLAPFGQGFPEPVFKLVNVTSSDVRFLKEKHLKFKLGAKQVSSLGTRTKQLDAIWFNANSKLSGCEFTTLQKCSLWVLPQWNEWQGRKTLQLRVDHAEF